MVARRINLGRVCAWRRRELEFVNLLRAQPPRQLPALFRLVSVHSLRRVGVSFNQIGERLASRLDMPVGFGAAGLKWRSEGS